MRLALDPRARRLLRLMPHTTVYTVLELVFLSLLALQCARLFWVILTPVGPVGDWRGPADTRPAVAGAAGLLATFDPFFRLSGQTGPAVVTSLNLQLFGVREDRASGRGSAIISIPDGTQRSFAVGDEIVPGVTLTAVGFDNVTITRNGAAEQLFMDQSGEAPVVGGQPAAFNAPGASAAPPPVATVPAPTVTAPPRNPAADIRFQPRLNGGDVTGVVVQPQGSGDAFRAAGLAPGDVITSVNGQRVTSAEQASRIAAQLGSGDVRLRVERDGRVIPLTVRTGQ